jgi:threonine synthase
VKAAFNDHQFREELKLGAINSINWARILAQITYYFYSWLRVTDGSLSSDANMKVCYSVPTGNFGNVLAGKFRFFEFYSNERE